MSRGDLLFHLTAEREHFLCCPPGLLQSNFSGCVVFSPMKVANTSKNRSLLFGDRCRFQCFATKHSSAIDVFRHKTFLDCFFRTEIRATALVKAISPQWKDAAPCSCPRLFLPWRQNLGFCSGLVESPSLKTTFLDSPAAGVAASTP